MASIIRTVHSRSYQYFENFQFSPHEFYGLVEENIKQKRIPKGKQVYVKFFQDKGFWTKREYLRVTYAEYIFDICAAPYGNGFFVSWWLGENTSWLYMLIIKIPFLGPLIEQFVEHKTYYQHDSATMFQECIRSCIKEAIEAISNQKGIRLTPDMVIMGPPVFGRRR